MDSCSKMNSQVEQIGRNLKSDWCFLEKIYDLLHEGNCLYVGEDEKIVDFKQPDEVMVSYLIVFFCDLNTLENFLVVFLFVVIRSGVEGLALRNLTLNVKA